MLIIMENRDVHSFAKFSFNIEAFGCTDVFQIDTAECRFEGSNDVAKFVRIQFVDFEVKNVDACKFLEQNTFAFHDRFGSLRSDISQSENSCSVGYDSYQISFCCVGIGIFRIGMYFLTCTGYTRCVCQGQFILVSDLFGWFDTDFSGNRKTVESQSIFLQKLFFLVLRIHFFCFLQCKR